MIFYLKSEYVWINSYIERNIFYDKITNPGIICFKCQINF